MWLRELLRDEDGTTAVEYAVMLALIVITCYAGVSVFGDSAGAMFGDSSDELSARMNQ